MPAPIAQIHDADPDDPSALACLAAYFALLVEQVPGMTPAHLPLPLPDAAGYRPPEGAFLLAHQHGQPAGCVSLHRLRPGVAEVKRLWVCPAARGQGLARALMHAIESRAKDLGYATLLLDSNRVFAQAITLYRATGWVETEAYTAFPANIWMIKHL